MIRVYDEAGNAIETHEQKGDVKSGERAVSTALLIAAVGGTTVHLLVVAPENYS